MVLTFSSPFLVASSTWETEIEASSLSLRRQIVFLPRDGKSTVDSWDGLMCFQANNSAFFSPFPSAKRANGVRVGHGADMLQSCNLKHSSGSVLVSHAPTRFIFPPASSIWKGENSINKILVINQTCWLLRQSRVVIAENLTLWRVVAPYFVPFE